MSKKIHRRQRARQDLVDIFRYYARESGFRLAQRFFAQAKATFSRLASMPGMGACYEHDHAALAGMRHFPVSRFRNLIVFYRPVADGIEIVHVLHGARDSTRESMSQGFSLGSYVDLVDYTGRIFRDGKASTSAELAGIFERLNWSAQSWQNRIEELGGDRLLGRFFASSRAKLREIRDRLGVRHLVNLRGCPVR